MSADGPDGIRHVLDTATSAYVHDPQSIRGWASEASMCGAPHRGGEFTRRPRGVPSLSRQTDMRWLPETEKAPAAARMFSLGCLTFRHAGRHSFSNVGDFKGSL